MVSLYNSQPAMTLLLKRTNYNITRLQGPLSFIVINSQVQIHVHLTCIKADIYILPHFLACKFHKKFHIPDYGKLRHVNLDAQSEVICRSDFVRHSLTLQIQSFLSLLLQA